MKPEMAPVLNDTDVIDLAPFPLAITDLETGEFVFLNALTAKLFGIDLGMEPRPNISSLYCDLGFRARVVERILNHGEVIGVEVPLKRRDGGIVWALGSARLVRFRERLCALIAVVDITKIKQLTEELEATQRELREALAVKAKLQEATERDSRAKSTLLTNLAHEIRTPLNGILGMARLLTEEESDPCLRTLADGIHKAARGLHRVTSEILEHTSLESDALPSNAAADPLKVIGEAIRLIEDRVEAKPIEVATWVSPDTPRLVQLDGEWLSQVLAQILDNAVKFTKKGTIKIDCSYGLDFLTISVADTGQGIPADQIDDVFHDFLQVDGTATRKHGGIGLGLSIAKRAVEKMGGEIHASSEVGVGSTFTVIVPAPPESAPIGRPVQEPRLAACLVSDSDEMAQMIARTVEFKGYATRRSSLKDWNGHIDPSDDLTVIDLPNDPDAVQSSLAALRILPPQTRARIFCLVHLATMPDQAEIDSLSPARFLSKPTDPSTLGDALGRRQTWNKLRMEGPEDTPAVRESVQAQEEAIVYLPLIGAIERDWSRMNGKFIRTIAALLGESCEKCLENIALGINREDPALAYAHAYQLRGSAANAGAVSAAETCRRILEAVRNRDFGVAKLLMTDVRAELESFLDSVEQQVCRKEA